ncbi:MAG: c-type cytochrome [Hyphomonadaceae bacterium]|nr:c-type cytochrome [Hyphomonadaceae bacterium]
MPRRHIGLLTLTTAVLLGLLVPPLRAQAPGAEALWRQMFARPEVPPAPTDNPLTPETIALGAALFADPRLSSTGRHACTSCHQPARSFTDGRRAAQAPSSGAPLARNTPALWNLAWSPQLFWDGRAPSLEEQVKGPIEAPNEMGGDWPTILRRLEADAGLLAQVRIAFPLEPAVSEATVVKALASYVRSLVSPPTRFDAWIAGDARALKPAEAAGFRLFTGKAGCLLCHAGWRFTDDRFHDIGLGGKDPGRAAVPDGTPGRRAFKTPSLREAMHTAPYMHDGSLPTLAAVLRHYASGFRSRPTLAPHMNRRLRLTLKERADLIAFLRTLSSEQAAPRSKPGAAPR